MARASRSERSTPTAPRRTFPSRCSSPAEDFLPVESAPGVAPAGTPDGELQRVGVTPSTSWLLQRRENHAQGIDDVGPRLVAAAADTDGAGYGWHAGLDV